MSKDNSPSYAQGVSDAEVDNALVSNGKPPIGPQPPNPAYPVMYLRGYEDTFGTEDAS